MCTQSPRKRTAMGRSHVKWAQIHLFHMQEEAREGFPSSNTHLVMDSHEE